MEIKPKHRIQMLLSSKEAKKRERKNIYNRVIYKV